LLPHAASAAVALAMHSPGAISLREACLLRLFCLSRSHEEASPRAEEVPEAQPQVAGQPPVKERHGGSGDSTSSGAASTASVDSNRSCTRESEIETQDSLLTLLSSLCLAEDAHREHSRIAGASPAFPFAAPEHLIQQLLTQVGPAEILGSRMEAALSIVCFPREVDELEAAMCSSLQAAGIVLKSKALPVLFEGILQLGNELEPSIAPGPVFGMTLESVLKLAQTDAFSFLVPHLQKTQRPAWLSQLTCDLEHCREASDLESRLASAGVIDFAAQVGVLEGRLQSLESLCGTVTAASAPARLERFLAHALPRVASLRSLEEDLQSATAAMRSYFAEPPSSTRASILRSLSSLLDLLPAPELEPEPEPLARVPVH